MSAGAAQDIAGANTIFGQIREKHAEALGKLGLLADGASGDPGRELLSHIDKDLADLRTLIATVALMRMESEELRELVSGYGT